MAEVTGVASFMTRTVATKAGLKQLIKNRPGDVTLIALTTTSPVDFAVKGPADRLPKNIRFNVTPAIGSKWSAQVYWGRNGLTVK